jgi:hypothetical protein
MMLVVLANTAIVMAGVVIHYEFLCRLSMLLRHVKLRHRPRVLLGVGGALLAHTVEVWLFAGVYYLMHHAQGCGRLTGNFDGSLMDCVYFSLTTFTTLGFGDIQPEGDMRFLTGMESLTGLVLITWTASFLFVEMQKFWDSR